MEARQYFHAGPTECTSSNDLVTLVAVTKHRIQASESGTGGAAVYLDETLIGDLPEFEEEKEAVAETRDVSDDDMCRAILRFLYTEPAQSAVPVDKLETPAIAYV